MEKELDYIKSSKVYPVLIIIAMLAFLSAGWEIGYIKLTFWLIIASSVVDRYKEEDSNKEAIIFLVICGAIFYYVVTYVTTTGIALAVLFVVFLGIIIPHLGVILLMGFILTMILNLIS